ncbi:alkaline phosphatase family protein [Cellulomonas gilvus]|uniref:Type I phosphodiesterase/nucleotide pyrophosphatase n=1 Tax=Cellulomonas gilvus (strain ATCC 13127 / NRRL B-14078) TaxID=593907 RepID=F8A3R8_CELGA|nr:nucleotide pyrophosphatase/phosphodiesterase family protein [Cellulomonas gilvus]AEI11971.1 type I phosphodiesterase/nucleotide pyrophosphatase [Cellulomonas gilvus ATCC 13127]
MTTTQTGSTPGGPAAARLADAAHEHGLVLPGSDGRACLGTVLPAAAGALLAGLDGAGAAVDVAPDEAAGWLAARERLGLPAAARVCVLLVDGLGHLNLAERAGHAPFLRRASAGSTALSSTFPSTTATALGTFGVGQPPGRTAMLGYTVRVPETGELGNLVSWTGLPDPEQWQPHTSLLQRTTAAGIATTSVGPARFAGSGLTRAALRGATYVAAESLAQRVDAAVAALRQPGLAYLYWGDVDKAGHHHGVASARWGDALADADAEIGRLARSLPRGTVLVVTADHGMVDVDPRRQLDVAHVPALAEGVALVAGEPRASHLHLAPGVDPADVRDRWAQTLGDAALVLTRDEAIAAHLVGDVDERVLPVLGDVMVAMTGRATVVDSRTQTPASLTLVGVHGSLTPHEMLVPCIVVA